MAPYEAPLAQQRQPRLRHLKRGRRRRRRRRLYAFLSPCVFFLYLRFYRLAFFFFICCFIALRFYYEEEEEVEEEEHVQLQGAYAFLSSCVAPPPPPPPTFFLLSSAPQHASWHVSGTPRCSSRSEPSGSNGGGALEADARRTFGRMPSSYARGVNPRPPPGTTRSHRRPRGLSCRACRRHPWASGYLRPFRQA